MGRSGTTALAWPATALVCCIWVVIACAVGSPSAPPSAVAASPTTAVTLELPTASPSHAATATAAPTPAPTGTPAPATPPASVTPSAEATPARDLASPPDGVVAESGTTVTGNPGTYCWTSSKGTACVDFVDFGHMRDLAEMDVSAAGAMLTFTTNPSIEFISWQASYGTPDGELQPLASGGSDYDPDSTATPPPGVASASFAAPGSGTWILAVMIHLANGDDASYGWKLVVPQRQ